MKDEEIVDKIKSGEIAYVGDFFINHNHNFNMTKAIAIANRNVGNDKVIVREIFKNLFGYEEISIHGVGFDIDAYYVIGYASYLMNKTKNLKVNIDIGEYISALNVTDVSNKSRYKKQLISSIRDIIDTSFEIKLNGRNYGRKIFLAYDYADNDDIVSVYFDPAFVALQSKDKILISGSLSEYKSIKRKVSLAVLDILRTNNYSKSSNEIFYADLKASVVSGGKTVSRVNESFKRAFEELVSGGFAEYCKLEEKANKKVVVKFKLTKKGMMHDTSSVSPNTPAIPAPVAAPVVSVNQVFMPADYDSMTLEQKLHALESKMAMIGINPEKLLHDQERAIIEGESEVVAEPDPWNTFDSSKFPDFIEPDNQADDELPF
ncbi:hypothetical protein SOX05_08850 [Pseudomonas putida]|nr:hypothetical protein [Pseudomonas putida]MDY4319370.1 hypothetical protein [Pseudomonas putida]MDY4352755.1 hypothetical protein [Pseudomonas putida]